MWCDGECIAPSDERCCNKRCGPDVMSDPSGEEEVFCVEGCKYTGEDLPGCCDSETEVWCDRTIKCVGQVGACIKKDAVGRNTCASTCSIIADDGDGKSLDCSNETSRGHEFGPDECKPRSQTCPSYRNRLPRRPRWPRRRM